MQQIRFSGDHRNPIDPVIKPWHEANTKPPFAVHELVILALLRHGRSLNSKEIFQWVCDNSKYYRNLAFDGFWSESGGPHAEYRLRADFKTDMCEAVYLYEAPLSYNAITGRATLRAADGKPAISHIIQAKEPVQPFRFLELPSELRNEIYNMVLLYPKSGIQIQIRRGELSPTGFVCSKDPNNQDDIDEELRMMVRPDGVNKFKTLAFSRILALSSTNKQIRSETLPIFYGGNRFYFWDANLMGHALRKMPEAHKNLVEHIAFRYANSVGAIGTLRVLAAMPKLRKLDMYCYEDTVKVRKGTWGRDVDAMEIPGVRVLGGLRGLEQVTFKGCPRIEAAVKADMLKPKPEKEKEKSGGRKKRKAGKGDEGDVQLGKGKKAKVGRS